MKDVIWFYNTLAEIGFPQEGPTSVHVDNASMITLASEYSGNHKRVKHFLVRLNFLIEQVALKVVELNKVGTDDNTVDTMTKPLGPTAFISHRNRLLGCNTGTKST